MPETTARGVRAEDRAGTPGGYEGYAVRDPSGKKIGTLRALFANAGGEPEYVRVGLWPLGARSVLIPVVAVAVDDEQRALVLQ